MCELDNVLPGRVALAALDPADIRADPSRRLVALLAALGFGLFAIIDLIHFAYWLHRPCESTEAQLETALVMVGWLALAAASSAAGAAMGTRASVIDLRRLAALLGASGFAVCAGRDLLHLGYWQGRAGQSTEAQIESVIALIGWLALTAAALTLVNRTWYRRWTRGGLQTLLSDAGLEDSQRRDR